MYTIFRRIYTVLDSLCFYKSRYFRTYNVHNFLLNLRGSRHSNFSANLDISYIYNVHNIPLNLRSSRYLIFLQMRTFHIFNVHNFTLNLRSSGNSIFLQIQTFWTYIMYTIFRWIYAILDIRVFCKSRHSVHIMYTISRWIYGILDIKFFLQI